jgi:hypothetical protein
LLSNPLLLLFTLYPFLPLEFLLTIFVYYLFLPNCVTPFFLFLRLSFIFPICLFPSFSSFLFLFSNQSLSSFPSVNLLFYLSFSFFPIYPLLSFPSAIFLPICHLSSFPCFLFMFIFFILGLTFTHFFFYCTSPKPIRLSSCSFLKFYSRFFVFIL